MPRSSVILNLIARVPDRELAEQIKARYYQDIEEQADTVTERMSAIQVSVEDTIRDVTGSTNEMIGEVLSIAKRQEGAVAELRGDFQSLAETVDQHDREIASFRQSRDQSIAERRKHAAELAESKADRASIHKELHDARTERQHMAETLKRIEDMLLGRPSNEEAQELIRILHETTGRVDILEQIIPRPDE